MRKFLLTFFCIWATVCLASDRYTTVTDSLMTFPTHQFNIRISPFSTDKGIWGGQAGSARIYCDITMPTITSECLVDVGAAMSQWNGVLGMCPRWFTMFNPIACPTDELFGAAKAKTAIMLTMRTYF